MILETMKAESIFVSYGLLSGQPIKTAVPVQAEYRRFHLRDELVSLTEVIWQQYFQLLWPMIRQRGLPEVQVFPLAMWSQAIKHVSLPGRIKPVISFQM